VKFAAIADWAASDENKFPVKFMCRELGVSEGGYYAWRKRPISAHEQEDNTLKEVISTIFESLNGNPGRRRVRAELIAHGHEASINRVQRLMKELGLVGRHPKAWRKTTTRGEHPNYAPDLVEQDFTAAAPNVKWCGDITYVKTWDGWAYFATVIDMHSRSIVGWSIANHMETSLVQDALQMAITHRKPGKGVIFHSDRGSQYTSHTFKEFCEENGVERSMGRTGVCFDNALSESFNATYKKEMIHTRPWPSVDILRKATFEFVEFYYNTRRRHSYLGYLTPREYELGYRKLEEIYTPAI